jgi:hypothetical protein
MVPGDTVAGFICYYMDYSKDYIAELMRHCDPFSILGLGTAGQLIRIYTPFDVLVIEAIGNLDRGDVYSVEAVKVTLEIKDVYIIEGRAYYLHYFKILL